MSNDTERPLRRKPAADYLTESGYPTAASYLAKLASVGGGPEHFLYGRYPYYFPTKLLEWARSRCTGPRRSTSDTGRVEPTADKVA